MRSALVENGIVTNVIVGQLPGTIECPDAVSIGWLYDGSDFRSPAGQVADAIAKLLVRYEERQLERFEIREGLSVSLRETTATKLSALVAAAQVQVAAENPGATFWIDDGGTQLDITAGELLANAAGYAMRYSELLTWVSARRKEIEASEAPLAVSLD